MKHVLAAVDGSPCSIRAARLAVEVATRFGATLTLVYAVPLPIIAGNVPVDLGAMSAAELQAGRVLLDEVAAAIDRPEVQRQCLEGASVDGLLAWARDNDVDLIVVGSKGRNVLSRVLLGSTTERLVHHSTVPVLVVR